MQLGCMYLGMVLVRTDEPSLPSTTEKYFFRVGSESSWSLPREDMTKFFTCSKRRSTRTGVTHGEWHGGDTERVTESRDRYRERGSGGGLWAVDCGRCAVDGAGGELPNRM